MLKPIPKFFIILLVSSLMSSSQTPAMDKTPLTDERGMYGSFKKKFKKTMDEAIARAEDEVTASRRILAMDKAQSIETKDEMAKTQSMAKSKFIEARDDMVINVVFTGYWMSYFISSLIYSSPQTHTMDKAPFTHEVTPRRTQIEAAQRAEEKAIPKLVGISRIADWQRMRNNLFNAEESENFFGPHNYKTYNYILSSLDKTIHQLICVFIYTLNSVYKAFDNYYHSPQCDKEEFRNIINSYFSGFSGFVEDLYGLISSRIVYSACDLLTHNDPNLKVMALKNRNIDDKEVQRICTILSHNQYLEELILDSNKITDIGVSYICSLLRKKTNLKKLSLCNNQVTSVGLKAISNALKHNTNLISLCMGGNLILRHELCKVESVNGPVNQLTAIHPHEDRLIKKFVTFLEEYFINKIQAQRIDFKETDPQMKLEWIR